MTGFLSKLAALGLLLAVPVAVLMPLGLWLVAELDRLDDEIADLQLRQQRISEAVAAAPALRDRLAEMEREQPGRGDLLQGANPALAAANLQTLLRERVNATGAQLESTQLVEQEAVEGFERLIARVRFTGDSAQLARLLRAVEAGKPRLFVSALDVRRERLDPREPQPADQPVAIAVGLDVAAFWQAEPDA